MEVVEGAIWGIIGLGIALVTVITAWIVRSQMRRRIREAIGVAAESEMELTSLKTWMMVKNIEERNRGGKLG